MHIEDGTGTGSMVEVDAEHMLSTHAVAGCECLHASLVHGDTYQVEGEAIEAAATVAVLFIRNDDPDRMLCVETVEAEAVDLGASAAIGVYMDVVFDLTYTSDGVAVTPVNHNRASPNVALATCYDTIPTLAGVAAQLERWYPEGADPRPVEWDLHGSAILGLNDSLTVRLTSTGTAGTGKAVVKFYYLEE